MKDLLEIILKSLAGYVPDLVAIISKPKRSILDRITNEPEKLNKALMFVGITVGIGLVFQAPLLRPGEDFITIAGSLVAFKIIAMLISAAIVLGLFRIMGGKGNFEDTLCAYIYIISPLYLLLILLTSTAIGAISSYSPELAEHFMATYDFSDERYIDFGNAAPTAATIFLSAVFLSLFGTIIWFAICWGAFRVIHQVSKIPSALAFLIHLLVFYWENALFLIIVKGLHGGVYPSMG